MWNFVFFKINFIFFIQELFEVKDDEEQQARLVDICDLLLAAGYFRVRLKGLSAFDKVIVHLLFFFCQSGIHATQD